MMGGGILTSAVAAKGYRYSKRWAWYALLSAFGVAFIVGYITSLPFYGRGIYAAGAVSFGLPSDPGASVFFLPLGVLPLLALLLPLAQFTRKKTNVV
jgi:hypothetical protein